MKIHKFFGKPYNFNYKNTDFTQKFITENLQEITNITVIQPVQTHSKKIKEITKFNKNTHFECDGVWTRENDIALSIKTADCMALVFKHKTKNIIANIHAGWRGVANKIASEFLKNFSPEINKDFEVHFSPSILSCCCEFTNPYEETPSFFHDNISTKTINNKTHYFVNLQEIIKKELIENSINPKNIFFTNICTKCSSDFWSHRCKEAERNISYVVQN